MSLSWLTAVFKLHPTLSISFTPLKQRSTWHTVFVIHSRHSGMNLNFCRQKTHYNRLFLFPDLHSDVRHSHDSLISLPPLLSNKLHSGEHLRCSFMIPDKGHILYTNLPTNFVPCSLYNLSRFHLTAHYKILVKNIKHIKYLHN